MSAARASLARVRSGWSRDRAVQPGGTQFQGGDIGLGRLLDGKRGLWKQLFWGYQPRGIFLPGDFGIQESAFPQGALPGGG